MERMYRQLSDDPLSMKKRTDQNTVSCDRNYRFHLIYKQIMLAVPFILEDWSGRKIVNDLEKTKVEVSDMTGKRMARENKTGAKAAPKKVQFEFAAPEAHEVFVAGEFNHWHKRANPLKKDKDGIWKLVLPLMPGRYEYRFLTDGNWENDRSCSGCVPNNFGSFNCVRIVE